MCLSTTRQLADNRQHTTCKMNESQDASCFVFQERAELENVKAKLNRAININSLLKKVKFSHIGIT